MPILEAIALKSAANLTTNLLKAGYKLLSKSKYTSYEEEKKRWFGTCTSG
jgi:hypothetical protein